MSRQYKFHNKEGLYFVSFATVYWIDLFVREIYFSVIVDNLNFYAQQGMEIFCWCIMPSHIHLIFRDVDNQPDKRLGRFKSFTSKALQNEITRNAKESRKAWILWMMSRAAVKTSNVTNRMLWQHHNRPIELWSKEVIEQKVNYIHNNPVKAGFVVNAGDWKYSSAKDYETGRSSIVTMNFLW